MLYNWKALKGKILHTWRFWNIKRAKPPYKLPEIIWLFHFLKFLGQSEKHYSLDHPVAGCCWCWCFMGPILTTACWQLTAWEQLISNCSDRLKLIVPSVEDSCCNRPSSCFDKTSVLGNVLNFLFLLQWWVLICVGMFSYRLYLVMLGMQTDGKEKRN